MSDTRLKLKIFISLSSLTFKNINKICQNISASSNKLNYLYIFCPILSFSPEAFIKSHQRLDTQAYTLYLPFRPFWRRKNYKKKKNHGLSGFLWRMKELLYMFITVLGTRLCMCATTCSTVQITWLNLLYINYT